jgi:predicted dehydrogenase
MTVLNVAIIGTGMAFEKLHYPAFQELADKYRIAAICDTDQEKARYWAGMLNLGMENVYEDYHDMFQREDINLFDIMVPISLNYKVTLDVAKNIAGSGKGIICEKPAASNEKDARAHRELPSKYNVPILIAENYRYNEETNIIRDMVRENKIGDIIYFIYHRFLDFPGDIHKDKFPAKEWRQYPDYQGGAILDFGVHDLAALRHIFGAVEKLHAFGRPHNADYSPYSVVNVNICFKSGITGQFSFYCSGKEAQSPFIGFRIFGTEGMIYLEERGCGTINVAYNNGSEEQVSYIPQRGYYNELLNFYNASIQKEPLYVTPELEYGDTKMVFDILRSIENEEIIYVDEEKNYDPGKKNKKTAVKITT